MGGTQPHHHAHRVEMLQQSLAGLSSAHCAVPFAEPRGTTPSDGDHGRLAAGVQTGELALETTNVCTKAHGALGLGGKIAPAAGASAISAASSSSATSRAAVSRAADDPAEASGSAAAAPAPFASSAGTQVANEVTVLGALGT